MRFLDPRYVGALLLLPLAASFWLLHLRARRRFRAAAAATPAMDRLSRLTTAGQDARVLLAALLALGLLVAAALRPQVAVELRLPEYERQDLVLILDRSASMHAEDVQPSRFARAVQEIKTFLTHKPDGVDRVALVGFAGTSLTISHLSRDTNSLFFFLDWIRDDATLHYGTDVAAALGTAREVVRRDTAKTRKVFVLLSDGDDHGPRVAAMLDELRRERIRVHCIGIGTPREMPIPIAGPDGTRQYLEDEQGRPVTTRFDAGALRSIAGLTGGRFFLSTTGRELAPAMQQIVDAERRQVGWTRSTDYRDAHRPALLAAAAAIVFLMVRG